jgi:hypothetical protein
MWMQTVKTVQFEFPLLHSWNISPKILIFTTEIHTIYNLCTPSKSFRQCLISNSSMCFFFPATKGKILLCTSLHTEEKGQKKRFSGFLDSPL